MKRLKSYGDDLDSVGEKGVIKDWGRRDLQDSERSSSHQHQHHQHHHHRRRFYSKSESLRKGLSCSSSSYDRDEERESSRSLRKRFDHDSDGFDRRKNFDRYNRDSVSSSPRNSSYNVERIHRSDSFSGFRREFPKGLRSDRERPRRDESVSSSWRRFSSTKDGDDEDSSRGNRAAASDQDRVSQRSPQGLRDVEDRVNRRSPRESRDIIEERVSRRSPLGSGDTVKSPQFSKDSSCEQSKSMEVLKKSDEVQKESGVSSEMEEGELEPEPHDNPESEPAPRPETSLGANSDSQKDVESDHVEFVRKLDKEAATLSSGVKLEVNGGKVMAAMEEVKQIIKLPDCLDDSIDGPEGAASKTAVVNESGKNEAVLKENREVLSSTDEKVCPSDDVQGIGELNGGNLLVSGDGDGDGEKEDKSTSSEVKGDVVNVNVDASSITEKTEEKRRTNGSLDFSMDKPIEDSKNKGKSFAVLPPIEANLLENCQWMETGSTNIRDDVMEGPRGRGFELFFSPVVKRVEKMSNSCSSKHKDVNLKLEPLELSLGLPNVSLPLVSREPDPAPDSYSLARSVPSLPHTLHSNSDAFTASVSFSGSQTFIHNPSCSLTQNSHDNYEKSVGSRPIFQGIDQVSHGAYPGQSSNELKNKESPLYHQMLSSGNGSLYASQVSQGLLNSQPLDGQHFLKAPQMSTGSPVSLNRQTSVSRQLSGVLLRQHDEVRSPSQSNGSSETRSECSIEKKRLLKGKSGSSLFRSNSQREIEQTVTGGTIFLEGFISAVVSEPIQPMSSRLHEMTEQSVACLKEIAYDIITKEHKHAQLLAYQKILQDRSDISFETLSKSHRVQLEILVAFKTGLSDFIRQAINVPSSNLIEIFLNRRCRNVACQSLLPVDECDCKVCTNKVGFCSACMCLVCSKFDMASNTCSWVGCDVCLHWCHTNCGIKKSYIRNGRSATEEAHAMTEMQFHCVACNHPSEMFGFVREVFRTCAKDWKAETLSRELGYVMRIFSGSNDTRGKQLNVSAGQMMTRLKDKTCLPEVYNHIMEFLNGSHSNFGNNTTFSAKAPILENSKTNSMVLPSSQETMLLASVSAEKSSRFENVGTSQQILDWNQIGVSSGNPELQMNIERKPFVDELESILRVKQAEAKMFQARSDDARREADGLKRIAIAKNAKIEEEYLSRLNRLNLVEAEERRRQKLEELQAVERAYREYLNMKMRMDGEIKDLLLRMEATRRNLNA
ncbi:hypothetical protein Sjap_013127 [Stephania japonica]|uniref:Protein OBERON 4 n=1 Tax=Stephania japonica TaxID=461633 RepID=A0AAP0IYJ0_9MAGN